VQAEIRHSLICPRGETDVAAGADNADWPAGLVLRIGSAAGAASARAVAPPHSALTGRKLGWRHSGALTGPAVVASVAYMDPGNFATNIQAGSHYGYDLLWVVVLANLVAILFQALSAKLGLVTGRNLAELCRDHLPPALVWTMWVVSEIAAIATDLAEFLGGAIGLSLMLNLPLLCGGQALLIAVGIIGATIMPHALYPHSGLTQARILPRAEAVRARLLSASNRGVAVALGLADLDPIRELNGRTAELQPNLPLRGIS